MKFWFFNFEGKFTANSNEFASQGVFSSCLVPINNYRKAKSLFIKALSESEINLIKIIDYYPVDGEALDPADRQNTFWIKWYEDAKRKGIPVFDVWHLYSE